jgi:hypothetical protein
MAKDKGYARVMHHIGGLSAKNDNSQMIRGGEDELTLITQADIPEETNVERLFSLGALRAATPDEIKRWEVSKGLAVDSPDDEDFVDFTTGSEGLKPGQGGSATSEGTVAGKGKTEGQQAAAGQGAGQQADADGTYKGMGKGELSEYTVPELKDFAKAEGIEGYASMNKDDLLNALTGQKGE